MTRFVGILPFIFQLFSVISNVFINYNLSDDLNILS